MNPAKPTNLDFTGLDQFSGLVNTGAQAAAVAGKPLEIELANIAPNPDQPRKHFDGEALQELATSIAARGVKSPISIRPDPIQPGRYLINHGERRWRASKLAGKTTIRAFIDEAHGRTDQLAENIQRENLSTREIVLAIAAMLDEGMTQTQIVDELGKSKAWVSKHAALTKLPDALDELLQSGRCRDASTLYELLQVWRKDEKALADLLAEAGDRQIVQADVEAWRAAIMRGPVPDVPSNENTAAAAPTAAADSGSEAPASTGQPLENAAQPSPATVTAPAANGDAGGRNADSAQSGGGDDGSAPGEGGEAPKQNIKPAAAAPDPSKVRKPLVQVRVGRREAVLLIAKKAAHGLVWVQYEDGTDEELDAAKVKLVAVTEGAK